MFPGMATHTWIQTKIPCSLWGESCIFTLTQAPLRYWQLAKLPEYLPQRAETPPRNHPYSFGGNFFTLVFVTTFAPLGTGLGRIASVTFVKLCNF